MDRRLGEGFVFIGGTGRSGTNILRKTLDAHESVVSLDFEHRFIIDPDGVIDLLNSYSACWSPFNADKRLKRFNEFLEGLATKDSSSSGYAEWELATHFKRFFELRQRLMDGLIDCKYSGTWPGADQNGDGLIWLGKPLHREELVALLSEFIVENISDLLVRDSSTHYVEDNTWNMLYARELVELMPRAKLLHVHRDPRDVVASFLHQRWCPDGLDQAVMMYKSLMRRIMEAEAGLDHSQCMRVSLERFVDDTSIVLTEICNFIGAAFSHRLFDVELSKESMGRWQQDFNFSERNYLNSELKQYIDEFA